MAIKHRILDREKVLAAARVMVTRDGIRELTFQTLAKELNIRSQSLYNYFSNLDAVIEALGTYIKNSLNKSVALLAKTPFALLRKPRIAISNSNNHWMKLFTLCIIFQKAVHLFRQPAM